MKEEAKKTRVNGVSVWYPGFNLKSFIGEKFPLIKRWYQKVKALS